MSLKPIEEAPRDGTKIVLYNSIYVAFPIGYWDVVVGETEEKSGGTWFLLDDSAGCMGDGILWPNEDIMPTHFWPLPDPPND